MQTIAEGIANGSGQTLNNLDAKTRAQVSAYLTEHHPHLDQTSINLNGPEQSRRDLAQNGLHNLSTIREMIQQSPDLIGKLQGRLSQGKNLLGTDDPKTRHYRCLRWMLMEWPSQVRTELRRSKREKMPNTLSSMA